ncbi:MAG: hypothetical protein AABY04_00220 [Candidatus Micrarchaeota archaeon]
MGEFKKEIRPTKRTLYTHNHLWYRQAELTMNELWNRQSNTETPLEIGLKDQQKLKEIRYNMIEKKYITRAHLDDFNKILKNINFQRNLRVDIAKTKKKIR